MSREEGKRPADEESESGSRGDANAGLGAKAGDILKKAITVGLGAAVLTEESIRALVGDLKLPKELVANLLAQAKETRTEFLGKFSTDLLEKVQSRVDPVALVNEVLRKNDIELSIKIKVTPKADEGESK